MATPGISNFVTCMAEQLEAKGFGEKRRDEIIGRFEGLSEFHRASGVAEPELQAMTQVFKELSQVKADKNRMALATLMRADDMAKRVSGQQTMKGASFSAAGIFDGLPGVKVNENTRVGVEAARAAVSMIEDDPRFMGSSFSTRQRIIRNALWATMDDVVEHIGKGTFGVQRGVAHLPNIVREAFGQDTGDKVAKQLAASWKKTTDAGIDMFNSAGGAIAKREDFHLPQKQSPAKMFKASEEQWTRDWMEWADWSKMQHPDGAPIKPEERAGVLKEVYETLTTGGLNKMDPSKSRGIGAALGNQMDKQRFLILKDADSWLAMHEKYGEGNVFDVMHDHVAKQADNIALVEMFGPNPEMGLNQARAYAMKSALERGGVEAQNAAAGVLKNVFEPMSEKILRKNPTDPESLLGATVNTASNMLTAAQLGSAAPTAALGDFATAAVVDMFNKTGRNPFGGLDTYLKTAMFDREHQRIIAAQSGFVADEAISSVQAATRFGLTSTYGPAVSRRIADNVLRLSFMQGHTNAARWTIQAEYMGLLARSRETAFADLPFNAVLQRAGITETDWNAFRTFKPWRDPKGGAEFLRPIDVMRAGGEENGRLFRLFQGMILDESRRGVPESTLEGALILKDTTTPDTLIGAIAHSFAMYKNFPVSMMMLYGRLAMSEESGLGRLGLIAGLGVSMTLMGGLATQIGEIAKGRDPMPMNNAKFVGASFLKGGALGIWGDFLFKDLNRFGGGPAETVAGPLVGLGKDVTQLAFGDAAKFLSDEHFKELKAPGRAVEFAKRYVPGTNLWWARLALERTVYDRLSLIADPNAYRKMNERVRKQRKDVGNEYFWPPGQTALPDRGPNLGSAMR